MAKPIIKILTSINELTEIQRASAPRIGVELPMEYLQKARVIGLYEPTSQKLCGGFVIAHCGALRCLEQIPSEERKRLMLSPAATERCFEINGLWLDHTIAPSGARLAIYLLCLREALKMMAQGKSHYVYAYSSDNFKLRQFYKNFRSRVIYEGPVEILPGMSEATVEVVEMGDLRKLPLTIAKNPMFLISRVPAVKRIKKSPVMERIFSLN